MIIITKKTRPLYTHTSPYMAPFTATIKDYNGRGKKLTVSKVRTRQSGLCGAFDSLSNKEYQETTTPNPTIASTVDNGNAQPQATVDAANKSPPDEKEVPSQRLANNLSRARSTIFELALCNDWEYFLTFTLDPKKYDRNDLSKFQKDLSRFIRNYRARRNANIKYLLIPEQHKDGAWHFHGFIMGLPESHLKIFTLEEHLPYYIRRKLESGQPVYDWEAYHKKFGFCNIESIRSMEAASKYVTKYVTKSFNTGTIESGGHLYYASQKLNRATVIAKGQLTPDTDIVFDFENDYVKTKWYPPSETPENYIEDDPVTQTIRRLRKERASLSVSSWQPVYDVDTGEIFPTPFDNYDNTYYDVDITLAPPVKSIPPPPHKKRIKSQPDKNQLSLNLEPDRDGYIKIDLVDNILPFD